MKIPMRWNVLLLIGAGYASLMLIFVALLVLGREGSEAYQVVKDPLMALLGGSLAISKDLVPLGLPDKNG